MWTKLRSKGLLRKQVLDIVIMSWGCRFGSHVPVFTYMERPQIRYATTIATNRDWVRMYVSALTLCWYCACDGTVRYGTSFITLLLAANINAEFLPSHHCLSMAWVAGILQDTGRIEECRWQWAARTARLYWCWQQCIGNSGSKGTRGGGMGLGWRKWLVAACDCDGKLATILVH